MTLKAESITLSKATVEIGDHRAIFDLSLTVAAGEYLAVVGPSGAGKSTLLKIIAGHLQLTSGSLYIGNCDTKNKPPQKRSTSLVFQDYALFPHMTGWENIAFPLQIRHHSRSEIRSSVLYFASALHLDQSKLNRYSHQMSGGEQQRVAIARALAWKPSILLLDEPLGALDPELRLSVRNLLRELHSTFGCTIVHVTHSLDEAFDLGQRIAVLLSGTLAQIGQPAEIRDHPASVEVADFLGHVRSTAFTKLKYPRSPIPEEAELFSVSPYALQLSRATEDSFNAHGTIVSIRPSRQPRRTIATVAVGFDENGLERTESTLVCLETNQLLHQGSETILSWSPSDVVWYSRNGKRLTAQERKCDS